MVTLLRAVHFFRAYMYTRTHKHSIDLPIPDMAFGYVTSHCAMKHVYMGNH